MDVSDAEARNVVRAFRKLSKDLDGMSRRLALQDLAACDHPLAADLLLEELRGSGAELRPLVRRVLVAFHAPATIDHLVAAGLRHDDPLVREQVLLVLGDAQTGNQAWTPAALEALHDPSPDVRAAAVRALGLARDGQALDPILECASDASVRVRQVVPDAVLRLVPQRAQPLLDSMAQDKSWRVRTAVARALGSLRSDRGLRALVGMLARETGRVREDVLVELRRLTHQDFGLHVDAWERFLQVAPTDLLSTSSIEPMAAAAAGGSVVYYGISSLSRRLVFVTDLSGSMSTLERGYGIATSGTRLEITRAQLADLVSALGPDVAINLYTFTAGVSAWDRSLQPMEPKAKARALEEIAAYRADGATNVYAALEACFDAAERSLDRPGLEDECPDTAFVLTDGAPSAGRLLDPELLLDYVAERHRAVQLRLHTIALATDPPSREFMQQLARITGGSCIEPLR